MMLQEFLQRLMGGSAPVQPMQNRLGLAPDMLEGPGAAGPGMLAYHNALSSMSAPQQASQSQPWQMDAQGFPPAPEPYAPPQAMQQPQMQPQQPAQMQQPLSRSGVPDASQGASGGGIGGFLGNLFNPGAAGRNQTVQWLQSQGMDEGMATLMAGNKGALQNYLLDRSKGSDPKSALELAKLQLEVGNLANPRLSPAEEERLRLDRERFGFEQQQAGRTGTIEEYEYARENDGYAGSFNQFQQEQRRSGATTINNNMGGEAFADAFAKGDAAALGSVSEAGLSAQRNIGRIDRLGELLGTIPTGAEANFKQIAAEWGISLGDDVDNIQAAQALINSLVPEQRPAGSGPMSDADLEMFKQSLPRIINQPGGNEKILTTMKAIARYDAEGAVIVQRLRRGELDRAAAFEALQNRKNPLAGLNDIFGTGGPASPRQPVTVDGYTIEQVD